MPTADQMQQAIKPLFPGLMGVELAEVTAERVVATMLVRPDLCTAGGVCHGGAFMAFADTIGAVGTVMNLPPGTRTTTIESKTNFLGAALVNTRITAESTPLHRGKTTQVWQTMIRSEAGKLCAVVTQTQMVLPAGLDERLIEQAAVMSLEHASAHKSRVGGNFRATDQLAKRSPSVSATIATRASPTPRERDRSCPTQSRARYLQAPFCSALRWLRCKPPSASKCEWSSI